MRTLSPRLLLLSFAVAVTVCAARSIDLPVTEAPARIDGMLDDLCWQSAAVLDRFVGLGGAVLPADDRAATRALVTADAEFLYIAVRCGEPLIGKLSKSRSERDSDVWQDDDIEVFIVPGGPDAGAYVQLAVNPAGTLMDAFIPEKGGALDKGYDSGARVAARIGADDWTAELAVPLARLPVETVRGSWGFQVARARRTTGAYLTSLQTPVSGFHEIRSFDRLEGIERLAIPFGIRSFDSGVRGFGENACTFELSGAGEAFTSAVIEIGGRSRALFDTAALRIMGDRMRLPYRLQPDDRGKTIAVLAYRDEHVVQVRSTVLDGLPESLLGDLTGSVFFLYEGRPTVLEIPVYVTGSDDDPLVLSWEARDDRGTIVGTGMTSPSGSTALVRLYWPRRRSGTYSIAVVLAREGMAAVRKTWGIRLVDNPWEVAE